MTSRARPSSRGSKPGSKPSSKAASAKTASRAKPAPKQATPDTDAGRPSPALTGAVAFSVAGAFLLAAGGLVPVVLDAPAGYLSWPLLVVLALVPAAVAAGCAFTGRHGLAAGLLLGLAALAPGRLVLDLQLFADASLATRPELYLPSRLLDSTSLGAGAWLLAAGHVLTAVAGFFAARAAGEQAESAGFAAAPRRARAFTPLLALVASVALLMAPMQSDDTFLLAKAAFDGPLTTLLGFLLLAGALPLAAALGSGSPDDGVAKGCLAGLGVAVLTVVVPELAAGLALSTLHVTAGPVLAMVVAVLLVALACSPWTSSRSPLADESESGDLAGEARLPGLFWWRLATGVLALLTGVASVIGAFAAQLSLHPGIVTAPPPESPARWVLLAAGLVLGLAGLLVLVPAVA
ncbi:hypothetical protein QMK34_46065, partial [Amycolatopsis sp. H20-H5]|nr:hypothetical protein [Amycolatopsis sp. H20-H5]